MQPIPSQIVLQVPRTALFGANSGRYEGGQIVVLNLFMCSWYQSEALLCPGGRRPPGIQQLRQCRPTPVKAPHKSVLDTRSHLLLTPFLGIVISHCHDIKPTTHICPPAQLPWPLKKLFLELLTVISSVIFLPFSVTPI